ncbi:MAG: hypothetical protein ACFB0G_02915 [Leptolyngbyaceae cyanobacterium]
MLISLEFGEHSCLQVPPEEGLESLIADLKHRFRQGFIAGDRAAMAAIYPRLLTGFKQSK